MLISRTDGGMANMLLLSQTTPLCPMHDIKKAFAFIVCV